MIICQNSAKKTLIYLILSLNYYIYNTNLLYMFNEFINFMASNISFLQDFIY